jgi:nucleotide-binding universal stress UspA family protein
MSAIKHLLVAVDFNETSDHALDFTLALARALGARVTAVHVYSLPIYRIADSDFVPRAEEVARIAEAAQRHLDALVESRRGEGVEITGVLRSGRPADEVCAEAGRVGADLIVAGTHGRGALSRAILGSVAQNLVRHAPVPVITVREPPAKK